MIITKSIIKAGRLGNALIKKLTHNPNSVKSDITQYIDTCGLELKTLNADTLSIRKQLTKNGEFIPVENERIGENLIEGLNDYLRGHCKVYKEVDTHCLKHGYTKTYTVIEAKEGEVIDFSRIGEFNKKYTILRYNKPEEARQGAKDILMKQFEITQEQQRELGLAIKGKDLYLNNQGDTNACCINFLAHSLPESEMVHNHPDLFGPGSTTTLSLGDIMYMIQEKLKSVTALNGKGEFSTLIRTSKYDPQISKWTKQDFHREIINERISQLRELGEKQELTPELVKQLEYLEPYAQNNNYGLFFSYANDKVYNEVCHAAYKGLFPKYGLEYTTNFSNLANL